MTAWLKRFKDTATVAARLGPLEWRVLEALWARTDAAAVRDLQPLFPEIAYTTLMTTLDRLHPQGRARPRPNTAARSSISRASRVPSSNRRARRQR